MEQNKILNKPFKQLFHITDIKHNIIGIPFISKYIPTVNILNSKILIKDKYTKTKNTALTFFQRLNEQPPFFSKFYPIYNQQRKHLKPLSGNIYNFLIKQVHRVNNILQLLDICQSTILNEELSINNIISNEKRNTDYFTKTPYFKPTFNITNYTKEQQQFLTMFNFEHS